MQLSETKFEPVGAFYIIEGHMCATIVAHGDNMTSVQWRLALGRYKHPASTMHSGL